MEVFKLYEYQDSNDCGIIFEDSIPIGDTKVFNNYVWIKLIEGIKINDSDKEYKGIAFENIGASQVDFIVKSFNNEWSKNKFHLFSDLFANHANVFKKVRKIDNKRQYLGLIGELAFIKKSQILKINNILDFYSKNGLDKFDFHFNDENNLDIKLGNLNKWSFILNLRQLESLTKESNNHDVCVIFPCWDEHNGYNLIELFEKIPGNESMSLVREQIEKLKFENINIFLTHKIDIERSEFIFFRKDFLPIIKFEQKNSLIGATFEIFALEESKINFESKVRELAKNE